MLFLENLQTHLDYLRKAEEELERKIKVLPKGKLIKKKNRNKTYYYELKNGKHKSLYKNHSLVQSYLIKESTELELIKVKRNIKALSMLKRKYSPTAISHDLWDNLGSDENMFHLEEKCHSYRGHTYRSKSELAIASLLIANNIEFKYEPAYELNGRIIYPDFVIKRPRDGKIIIWEHAGLMSNETYRKYCLERIEFYCANGITLWDNLIYTFDTVDGSLNLNVIEKILHLYIL